MSIIRELGEVGAELTRAWSQILKYRLELEADSVKKWSARVAGSIAAIFAAMIVFLAGLGFIVTGLFLLLSETVEAWVSASIVGGTLMLVALVILIFVKR